MEDKGVKAHHGGPKWVIQSPFLKSKSNDFSLKTYK
jgi:hypothetical protein